MNKFAVVILVLLAGCAANPEKLQDVGVAEASRMTKPSKPLASFASYEIRPMTLSDQVRGEQGRVDQAAILEQKISRILEPLFGNWSRSEAPERSGTLYVATHLVSLRIVSGGARFWAGGFAGDSQIDLDLTLTDSGTGEIIAKSRVARGAGGIAGAWSIGKSDRNLHDYIAAIVYEYLSASY